MNRRLFNLPNALSASRIVLLPLLFCLAWHGHAVAFLIVLGCSLATDSVDGLLARKMGVDSDFGARLDTIGDLATYCSLPLFAWWLWPGIMRRELALVVPVVLSYILPVLAGFLKFGCVTSYHTYAAKTSAVLMSCSVILLFSGITPIPFRVLAVIPVLAGVEEMLITLILPRPRSNIHTLRHAMRIVKAEREGGEQYRYSSPPTPSAPRQSRRG